MKNLHRMPLVLVALAALVLGAMSASGVDYTARGGTAIGSTNSHVIASAAKPGTPVVTFLSATSDKATSKVQFYLAADGVLVTGTSAAGATNVLTLGGTNKFAAGNVIVIRDVSTDAYQRATVGTVNATNVTLIHALNFAVGARDVLYRMTPAGSLPVGAATASFTAPVWAGSQSRPLLVELDGTTNCTLNAVLIEHR